MLRFPKYCAAASGKLDWFRRSTSRQDISRLETKNAAKTVHALNGEFCSLVVYEILRDSVFQYFSNILDMVKRIDCGIQVYIYFIYKLIIVIDERSCLDKLRFIAILWGDIFSMIAEQEIYIFLSSNPNISNFVLLKFNIFRGILLFNIIYYFVKKDVKKEMLIEKKIIL